MDTGSLRENLGYFSDGDGFFQSLLQSAKDCYPEEAGTLTKAKALIRVIDEAREEATVELIKRFGREGFSTRELTRWLSRIAAASRAAGLLEGRFALNVPVD